MNELIKIEYHFRHRREELGLSQSQLAKLTEYTPSVISDIESGRKNPSINSLLSFSEALNVPIDYFFQDCDKQFMLNTICELYTKIDKEKAHHFLNYVANMFG